MAYLEVSIHNTIVTREDDVLYPATISFLEKGVEEKLEVNFFDPPSRKSLIESLRLRLIYSPYTLIFKYKKSDKQQILSKLLTLCEIERGNN